MNVLTKIILTIGRKNNHGNIHMLGTGFFISNTGLIATSRHVVGNNDNNLVVILSNIDSLDNYQDTTDNRCRYIRAKIIDIDPFRDIAILKIDIIDLIYISIFINLPTIGGFDDVHVGEEVIILGYPHCVEGRRVLTYQRAVIGAKVMLESEGIKSKHAVINTQTRPGQSGSLVFSKDKQMIVGMLIGAFAPNSCISLGGINPRELHQTTYCISSEYIKDMI